MENFINQLFQIIINYINQLFQIIIDYIRSDITNIGTIILSIMLGMLISEIRRVYKSWQLIKIEYNYKYKFRL